MSAWGFTSSFLLLASTLVSAMSPPGEVATPPTEIVITSQSLVFKNQENTAFFEGKVVMTKGDFIMHADQMIVYFASSPPMPSKSAKPGMPLPAPELPTFGNRAVSLIDASGNVILQRGEKKAKSRKAVYHQADDKLVLTGDPEAWEEGYHVTGTKMTMYLKEDRSIVEGGSRVIINNDMDTKSR
jgi:lipopolysaccharide export system protein LptA